MPTMNRPIRGHSGARRVQALALLLGIALSAGLLAPTAATAATQVTAIENVNVRAKPSTTAKLVGALYRGQTVTALSRSANWTKISFEGGKAYVASRYLSGGSDLPTASKVDAGTVKITTAALNLRKGPGLSYKVIKVLPKGTRVTMTGKTARGFAELINGASTGWASTQYLAKSSSGLPAIIGTRVATADLDIRTTSGADSKTVAEVKKGTVLSVTGATQNGRAQIVYKKKIRWVTAKYLANPRTQPAGAPGSSQDHRPPLRDHGTEHPVHLQGQVHLDRRGADRHQAEHHRRDQEEADADRLQQCGPLGDGQVPVQDQAEGQPGWQVQGREGPQAQCDQGASGDLEGVPGDRHVLRCPSRFDSGPPDRAGARLHDPELQVRSRQGARLPDCPAGRGATPTSSASTT